MTAEDDRALVRLIDDLAGEGYSDGIAARLTGPTNALSSLFGAGGASVALISDDGQELVFVAADDETASLIVGTRVPRNRGIVGFVATSGQSIAVSDVTQDLRFARDVADDVGYVPDVILAAPLMDGDTVLGVVEILDPSPLTSDRLRDLDVLETVAVTLAQVVQAQRSLRTPVTTFLTQAARDRGEPLADDALSTVTDGEDASLSLINAVRALAARDSNGLELAAEILQTLARAPRASR